MDKTTFWSMVDEVVKTGELDLEKRNALLIENLTRLKVIEIIELDKILHEIMVTLHNDSTFYESLYSSGFGFTDDGLEYYIYWLISQGEEIFNKVVNNPTLMRDFIPEGTKLPENESLCALGDIVYERKRNKVLSNELIPTNDEYGFILLLEDDYYIARTKIEKENVS